MTIITTSGSQYNFLVKNGKFYFQKGMTEGIVVSLSGIQIGEHLKITYYPLDIYSRECRELSFIETNKIVSLT